MAELPGVEFAFTQPIEMRTSEMLTGARGDLAVKIFGPDLKVLADLAGRVQTAIAGVKGASEVFTASNDTVDYLQIDMDRLTAGRTGLSVTRIEDELRALLEGRTGRHRRRGAEANQHRDPRARDAARRHPSCSCKASWRPATAGSSASAMSRTCGAPRARSRSTARTRRALPSCRPTCPGAISSASSRTRRRPSRPQVQLPPGYRLVWGGEFENQRRAAARLAIVVPIALGLIFLVLFATLRSLRQAVLILANVPFALIGGILALWVSGEYLSVPASVGFIALLGIAVLNGLVLVSHFNQLLASGTPLDQVVFEGSLRRLRPVLMTASIAAFGLVPLLFASGPGSEIQKPLAIVVIGGLVTSTALTLVLLPILFRRFGVAARSSQVETRSLSWTNPFAS